VLVEAELSDWLKEKTAHREERRHAEDLFDSYKPVVEVKLECGKFSKLKGPECDIDRLEDELMRMYQLSASSGPRMMNSYDSVDNKQQQQQQRSAEIAVGSPQRYVHSLVDGTNGSDSSLSPVSPAQQHHSGDDVRTSPFSALFTDEMDVEKHVYNYLLFKHGHKSGDISSRYECSVGLKRAAVDMNQRRQYRLQVTAGTQDRLSSAFDELAEMIVKLTEENIIDRQISLFPKECFAELEAELKKKDVLLLASSCRLIGPAAALDAAQSTVDAAVSKMYDRKSTPRVGFADDVRDQDFFTFHITRVQLTIHVRQGIQRLL